MATLDEADLARDKHADTLALKGAHAVGVETGKSFGHAGWVVVAYVSKLPTPALPSALEILDGPATVYVPLVVKEEEPFEPQQT